MLLRAAGTEMGSPRSGVTHLMPSIWSVLNTLYILHMKKLASSPVALSILSTLPQ